MIHHPSLCILGCIGILIGMLPKDNHWFGEGSWRKGLFGILPWSTYNWIIIVGGTLNIIASFVGP